MGTYAEGSYMDDLLKQQLVEYARLEEERDRIEEEMKQVEQNIKEGKELYDEQYQEAKELLETDPQLYGKRMRGYGHMPFVEEE